MKEVYCAEHPCTCDLGMWYSRIDWDLLDEQIKTLARLEHQTDKAVAEGAYGEQEKAGHWAGLYNLLADLWDMRPAAPAGQEDFPRRQSHE